MNYKEAKKIQTIVNNLDGMNEESSFVAAVEKHWYNEEYSVYIYGRKNKYNGTARATRIAMAIADNSETLIAKPAEYNAGTTEVEMVNAWEIF